MIALSSPLDAQKKHSKSIFQVTGKKKRHTIKTELIINQKGKIIHLSKPHAGSIHDLKISRPKDVFPDHIKIYADSGYQGLQKQYPRIYLPIKRRKCSNLSEKDKIYNQSLAKKRIAIEHKIGQMKIFQILGQCFRNTIASYALKISIVAGLVNIKNGF